MSLSSRLKELRKARGVSQKQVAESIGINERAMRNYEIEARKPEHDVLISLADYFEVSLDDLVGREWPKP